MGRPLQQLQQFFRELKRRNVYKVAVTYAVVAFVGFQAAKLLIPSTVLPTWTDEFFLFLLIIGFPVAVVFAWAFELTPEGVRRTAEAEPVEGEAEEAGAGTRTAYKVLFGLGLVGAAVAGGWYLTGGGGTTVSDRSVAVLPFEAQGQQEPGPFTAGMDDALSNRLSNVSDLRVSPSRAVQAYRDTALSSREIARDLGVSWLVSGEVLETEEEIRVIVQLVNPATESQMWSEEYTRELEPDELFDLQSDIATRIAGSLEAELSEEEQERVRRQPTADLDAYQLYVRGRRELDERTEEGMRRAVELFGRAISQDSSYALAWSGLADALGLLSTYGFMARDTVRRRAVEAARRAVKLAPNLAEAHASMGLLRLKMQEGPSALRELRRAVKLKPSYGRAFQWLGDLEGVLGRRHESLEHLRKAVELDPASPSIHSAASWAYWWVQGPEGRALEHARKAVELEPGFAHGHEVKGAVLSAAGRQEDAIAAFRRAIELAPEAYVSRAWAIGGLGTAYVRSGDTARAREQLQRLESLGGAPFQEARIRAVLGDREAAFDALEEIELGIVNVWALRFLPAFDPLRDDPRFGELIRKMNVAWGLNPDGSLPDSVDVSFGSESTE